MAKKSKVSIDDFVFVDEEESQPLNIIAKSIHKESKSLDTTLSADNPAPLNHYEMNLKTDSKQITSSKKNR